jgi:membrane-bound serine protease (ClpP class)
MMKSVLRLSVIILILQLFSYAVVRAEVVAIKAAGVVNPVMAEFIEKSIDEAVLAKADLFVIQLDTPGGLDTSMRSIVKKIISSEVPVAVHVSPSGARAASAGVFITIAAHIAAMSPGTNIGAAHPVGVGGKIDETMAEKAVNDAAAYIRSLAEKRDRNADWAEEAVRKSVSVTEAEALALNVIDLVSPDMNALLKDVDGRVVQTEQGERVLKVGDAAVRHLDMNLRHKILNVLSDPNIAYLLMLLGFYGIFFELTNPGAIFPGVLGAISLIIAFYSFQTLPVNYAGLLLILLGIVLFVLEIKVTSFGMLTIGGLASLTLGSLMLFESPLPFLRLSLKVILPAVIITTLFFSLTVWLVIRAYRRKPATGPEGLVGSVGEARTDIHEEGMVFVHGELWRAWSDEEIKAGQKVEVVEVEKLKVKVKPVATP